MMNPRIRLFAEHKRDDWRTKLGDPLVGLAKHVDFEALASSIGEAAPRPSGAKGGRPPYPTLLMIKNLTDSSSIPDVRTIWLFRDRLAPAGVGNQVFHQERQQLARHGYVARCGQIFDASLVHTPIQLNKREEAETVKQGACRWNKNRTSVPRNMSTRNGPRSMARITSATSSTPGWISTAC